MKVPLSYNFRHIGLAEPAEPSQNPTGRFRRRKRTVGKRRNAGRLIQSGSFPLAVVRCANQKRLMADVIYLSPDENMPGQGDDQRWLIIEASDDGRFFGTGGSFKTSGEWVGYGSLPKDDVSLETALVAAQQWAEKYDVPIIWIQQRPNGS